MILADYGHFFDLLSNTKMWVTRFMSLMTISSPIFSAAGTKEPNPRVVVMMGKCEKIVQ